MARGAVRLPPLRRFASAIPVFHEKPGVPGVARILVDAGAARREDWDPDHPGPARLIQRVAERLIRHLNRDVRDSMPLYAFMRPWGEYLDEIFSDSPEGDERWVLGLQSEDTHRIRVCPLIEALGERTAGAVLAHLTDCTPLCVEGPDDLEWIIDGWDTAGTDEQNEEAKAIRARAEEATELTARIGGVLTRGRSTPIGELEDRRIRRLLHLLVSLSRRTPDGDDRAWRATDDVDWGLPRPVIHLVWDDGCALSHALDEAEYLLMQDGSHSMPQEMWLLDPSDPEDAALAWGRWVHLLRRTRAVALLVDVVEELTDCLR